MERKIVRHATRLSAQHEAALDPEFRAGQRVRTIDGFLGRVLFAVESFAPGNVQYQITLDNGAGGGTFLGSQLRPVPESFGGGHQVPAYLPAGVHTADLDEHEASLDYPEMGDVLTERPDPGRQLTVIGMLRTGHYFQDTWSTDHNPSYHPGPMPRLYHGTNHPFGIGHHVEPGHQTHYEGAYDGMEDEASTRVHATPSVEQAWQHADNAVHEHGGSHHVFEVEPTGKVTWGDEAFPEDFEHDDEMNAHATRMSQSPFKVKREVPYNGERLPFTQRHQAAAGPYYHGTRADLKPGDWIEPGHKTNFPDLFGHTATDEEGEPVVYATKSREGADRFAEMAKGSGRPRTYHVEPESPEDLEEDPEEAANGPGNSIAPGSVRSRFPLRVVREAAQYADGFDPREDEYNGEPQVGGVYWGAPAQQAFVDSELGQPEDPAEMMGLEPPPEPPAAAGLESTAARYLRVPGPGGEPPVPYYGNMTHVRHPADTPARLYHGTGHEASDGDPITPGHPGNYVKHMKHNYMTEDLESARSYAFKGSRPGDTPHVYEVKPTGPYGHRADARGAEWATEEPLEVVGEAWRHHQPLGQYLATTINNQKIDDHGDAPEHGTIPRAAEPNSYDERSTEAEGDGKWDDPLPMPETGLSPEEIKRRENGATIGMYPEGISAGNGPGIGVGAITASTRDDKSDRWHEYNQAYRPDTIHRGIHVQLPGSLHDYVHDEAEPVHERAHALASHFQSGGLGMHWTPHTQIAHRAIWNAADKAPESVGAYGGYDDDDDYGGYDDEDEGGGHEEQHGTDVMFHAARPGRRNEIRDPKILEQHQVGWAHSRDEDETSLRPGSPLKLEGISWKKHEPEYPNEPFEHYDFAKPMRHTAGYVNTVNSWFHRNIHEARVPWTPEQRTQLHSWQEAPTATEGDFVPSHSFTNKNPEYVPEPDPETEFAEAVGPRAFTEMTAKLAGHTAVEPAEDDLDEGDEDELPPDDDVASGHQTHDPVADEVFAQLAEDFPPEVLDWVFDVEWEGPLAVPVDQVDAADEDQWEATGQPEKVEKFRQKIEKKEEKGKHPKPAILIARPSYPALFIADGHHRYLAERELEAQGEGDREDPGLWAFVATVPEDDGPWMTMHDEQEPGGGDGLETGEEEPGEPGEEDDMIAPPPGETSFEPGADPGDDYSDMGFEPQLGLPPMSQGGTPSKERAQKALAVDPMGEPAPPDEPVEDEEEGDEPGLPFDDEEDDEGEDDKPPPAKKEKKAALAAFVRAAGDPAFRFEFTAAWADVKRKASRIQKEGGVRITAASGSLVIGEVKGDHATYESGLQYYPGRPYSVMAYSCGCPWATFHQDADYPGRFNGRLCSHALALGIEARQRGSVKKMMFPEVAGWPEQVVVKSEPPWHPSDKAWARQWEAPMTRRPVMSSLDSLIDDSVHVQAKAWGAPPAVTAARALIRAGESRAAVTSLLSCAGLSMTAVSHPVGWDEIGERHPTLYGDPEVHGEKAEGADGEGVGWAANQLANDRPEDPGAEGSGAWDLMFHREKVHPKHIDYARHGSGDPRVRHAREGYASGHPEKVPPAILVHRHGVYQVADGHHRAEGADLAGKKVDAYVAYSDHEDVPFSDDGDEGERKAPFHGAKPHPGVAAHRNYFSKEADQANAPWGAQNVSEVPPAKPYGATSPPEKDRDPGSYGPLSGPDPDNWGEIQDNSAIQMPLTSDAVLHHDPAQEPDVPEYQESHPYTEHGAPGPSTTMTPRDPQGLRMEEMARTADQAEDDFRASYAADIAHTLSGHWHPPDAPCTGSCPMSDPASAGAFSKLLNAPHTLRQRQLEQARHAALAAFTASLDRSAAVPDWVSSQRRDRGLCESCGEPATTVNAGTGKEMCWNCHEKQVAKHEASVAEPQLEGALAELKDEPEGALEENGVTAWGTGHQATYEDAKAYNLARSVPDYPATSTADSGRAQHPRQETQNPGIGSMDDPYSPDDPSIMTVGNQQWGGGWSDSGDLSFRPDVQEHLPEQEADHDPVAQFHLTAAAQQYATDGAVSVGDGDIAAAAQAYLRKTADVLPPEEAEELIREGRGSRARNLDLLDLKGTHYEDHDELDDHEDDVCWA